MTWFAIVISLTLCVNLSFQTSTEAETQDKLNVFSEGLKAYYKTGAKGPSFERALDFLSLKDLFRNKHLLGIKNFAVCSICRIIMAFLLIIRRKGARRDDIAHFTESVCFNLKIESKKVCYGVIERNIDIFLFIFDNRPTLDAKRICAVIGQDYDCPEAPDYDWTIDIPTGSSPPRPSVNNSNAPLKIAHLTDFHYDPVYTVGSNAKCNEYTCCGPDQGVPATPEDAAGYWGSFPCDTPWHVIIDALRHITSQHTDLDYVYFTGDIVAHRLWNTSHARNTDAISTLLRQFKTSFGATPVFPILGNHEPHPVNLYAPLDINDPNMSTKWLFNLTAQEYSRWLPAEALETIRIGGYYTVLVKPGFRIIALNSNVCFTYNWWLLYEHVDLYGQLKWMVDTLLTAERNGERVHILSHLPSSEECLVTWAREFRKIVERFSNTITGIFNGHTHKATFLVYHSSADAKKAEDIAWSGGSLTTFGIVHPNYIVYHVDPQNLEVVNYEQWSYNIDEANLTPEKAPNWRMMQKFKEAYGLSGLTPKDMGSLVETMAKNFTLAQQYQRFAVRDANVSCDNNCLQDNLCQAVTTHCTWR